MQVKTRVKAGGISSNHNETLVRAKGQPQGLTVKSHVKAGSLRQGGDDRNSGQIGLIK
jgi:hypothetical protein